MWLIFPYPSSTAAWVAASTRSFSSMCPQQLPFELSYFLCSVRSTDCSPAWILWRTFPVPSGSGEGAKTLTDPATICCVLNSKTKNAMKKVKALHGASWWRRGQNAMGMVWKKELLRLNLRKNLLSMRTAGQWSSFPREVVLSLSLEIFNTWLGIILSNPVWSQRCSCFEQEVGIKTSWGPFQPEWTCDSCHFD